MTHPLTGFKRVILFASFIALAATASVAFAVDVPLQPRESLKTSFPNLTVTDFRESVIPGLYEVVAGDQIIYWSSTGHMVFGEIWTKEGKSLTAERREEIARAMLRDLPLDKAIVIGNGPHQTVEFIDPDCPYCHPTEKFLSQRTDVTRHIFFYTLPFHKDAAGKVKKILCGGDRAAVYKAVMDGQKEVLSIAGCQAEDALQEHLTLAAKLGVRGTPAIWIDGVQVNGADIPRMGELLSNAQLKSTQEDVRK
jgi:thiol:disulfide interchange protein DsbC